MPDQLVRQLLDILERERAAIKTGDYAVLPELGQAKEQAVEALSQISVLPQDAQRLSTLMAENARLLQAAMAGVQSASDSIQSMRNAGQRTVVYGKDGKTSRIDGNTRRISQKL